MAKTEVKTCAEALRLLAAHLDHELDDHAHAEVQQHLATCRSCFSRAEFERQLKAGIKELGSEPVRSELSIRVRTLIREFTATAAE
jgi:anti-sigma factor (TIGR02949 family)